MYNFYPFFVSFIDLIFRKDDSKISISRQRLLEVLRFTSLNLEGRKYESHGLIGSDECIMNYTYLPTQLYGVSVLNSLTYQADAYGSSENKLLYRVLIPVHFPKALFNDLVPNESFPESDSAIGYLYVERQYQFGHQEILSLWSIAKLMSFLVADHLNK